MMKIRFYDSSFLRGFIGLKATPLKECARKLACSVFGIYVSLDGRLQMQEVENWRINNSNEVQSRDH